MPVVLAERGNIWYMCPELFYDSGPVENSYYIFHRGAQTEETSLKHLDYMLFVIIIKMLY